jgi:MSHA biogenesis protein MshI
MSEQTINLYLKLGVQRQGYKNAVLGGLALLLLTLGFAVAGGLLAYGNASMKGSVVSLARENQKLQGQVAAASQLQATAINELRATLTRVQHQRHDKAELLQVLERAGNGDHQGFSEFLLGLARQHQAGIALSHIQVRERGTDFVMSGTVREAKVIPDYLLRLGHEPAFSGMAFGKVSLTEAPPNTAFEVRSWSLGEDES